MPSKYADQFRIAFAERVITPKQEEDPLTKNKKKSRKAHVLRSTLLTEAITKLRMLNSDLKN